MTVELEFDPQVEGEEAGVTLFLQRNQHFDLGVVAMANSTAEGGVQKFIQLKTITAKSAPDGLSDPLSRPGIFPLEDDKATEFIMKVQAVNASTYIFSYAEGKDDSARWKIIGYGDASEVSGGFTGVSFSYYGYFV